MRVGIIAKIKYLRSNKLIKELRNNSVPSFIFQAILHFDIAACTNLPISSLACFFALSVMPSNASRVPGDVCKGSNSRRWPSLVGMVTRAVVVVLGMRMVLVVGTCGKWWGVVRWDADGS